MNRFPTMLRTLSFALSLIGVLVTSAAAQTLDPANPYAFEKKAVNPDGTSYVGPPNVGDTINYVLTYKPGTTGSGSVTIDDTLSPNLSYAGPTTSSPGWTWGSSPYATGNHEQYVHPGFGPGSGSVVISVAGAPVPAGGAGDGTIPVPVGNKVFGVNHHTGVPAGLNFSPSVGQVNCWNLTDLSSCGPAQTNSTTGNFIRTPLTPQSVVVGSRLYFPGFTSTGNVVIGCFDSSNVACNEIPIPANVGSSGHDSVGGVVEDGSGHMYVAVRNKLFCVDKTTLAICANPAWTSGINLVTSPQPLSWATNVVYIAPEFSATPTKLYVHVGNGYIQCFDTISVAVCTGWSANGVQLGGGLGVMLSSIPNGSSGDGGVCLWTFTTPSARVGCVSDSGAVLTTSPLTIPGTPISSFRIPGTARVFFPNYDAPTPGIPTCFDFVNATGTPCGVSVSLSAPYNNTTPSATVGPPGTVWPGTILASQYGFALDPVEPSKCMLALGHNNLLWRFDYTTGKPGCGVSETRTPEVNITSCSGKEADQSYQWSSVTVQTAGANGVLTVSDGTNSQQFSVSANMVLAVPASFIPGAQLTFTYAPAANSPSNIDILATYVSKQGAEICYSAKVKECGAVSNTAIMKGTFNTKAFTVTKTVDLGKAKGPNCDPVDPPESSASCLTPDTKVTCGKTPGTYVITLNANTGNGAAPTAVEITPVTPGVTIVNATPAYQVNANGQVVLTVAGANPGDVLEFDISGSRPDPKAGDGMSLCCAGKIKVTIPADIKCDIVPEIKVTKSCLPAKLNGQDGFTAKCQLKVVTTGAFTTPITISETLAGTGTVTYVGATDPWSCTPPSATSPAPMSCTLPGNTLNAVTDTSVIDVKVDFANANDAKKAKNCVQHIPASGAPGKKFCVPFTIEESTVDIVKTCGPVEEGIFDVKGTKTNGFGSKCEITVKTTGPQTGTLTFADNLTGGTASQLTNTSTPAWTCGATSCSIPGAALNQTASTSTFQLYSVFANAGAVKEGRNCAIIARGQTRLDKDCVTFGKDDYDLAIQKTGKVLNQAIVGYEFDLAVTNVGAAFNGNQAIQVTDVVPAGMTFTSAVGTDWACATLPAAAGQTVTCTYTGAGPAAAGASLGSIKIKTTTVGLPNQGLGPFKNCADVSLTPSAGVSETTLANNHSCVVVDSEPDATVSTTKTCAAVTQNAAGTWEAKCKITVATTGNINAPLNVAEMFAPGAAGNAGSVTFTGSSTGDPWSCTPATAAAGTPLNCTLPANSLNATSDTTAFEVKVNFTDKGWIEESKNCAKATYNGQVGPESCVNFTGDPSVAGTLNIKKVVISHAELPLEAMQFTVHANCTGNAAPTMTQSLLDGETKTFQTYTPGTSCTVQEDPPGQTRACGNMIPRWTTAYIPPTALTNFPNGGTVVVQNTLDCDCPKGYKLQNGKCDEPPPPPLSCDKSTAKLSGDSCRCIIRGMVPVSKTACGCPDGTQLKNGECRKVVVPPRPPKDPVCGKGQRLQNHKCVDVPPPCAANERRNAAGKCIAIIPDCPRGQKWNGKRCVSVKPDCARGTHWNGKRCIADVPDCPRGTVFNGKRCVPTVVQCEPGQIRIGKRCIDKPHCARGQIALPGTGICVDIKPREPKPDRPDDGPRDTGGCVPLPGVPCR